MNYLLFRHVFLCASRSHEPPRYAGFYKFIPCIVPFFELSQEKKNAPAVMDEIKQSCGVHKVVSIQGGPTVSPVFRQSSFDLFATESKQIMVASDVLARGVDIPSVRRFSLRLASLRVFHLNSCTSSASVFCVCCGGAGSHRLNGSSISTSLRSSTGAGKRWRIGPDVVVATVNMYDILVLLNSFLDRVFMCCGCGCVGVCGCRCACVGRCV